MGSAPLPGKFSARGDDSPRRSGQSADTKPGASQAVTGSNALSAFNSEDRPVEPPKKADRKPFEKSPVAASVPPSGRTRGLAVGLGLAAIAVAATAGVMVLRRPTVAPPVAAAVETRPGQVTLETLPAGAEVLINGQARGITPLTLPLEPGHYQAVIRH